jgi:hypothetical protein
MNNDLSVIVTVLIALSVAVERAVEIVKGMVEWLDKPGETPREEGRRRAVLHLLAAVLGVGISWLAYPVLESMVPEGKRLATTLALGLLASGGSGFWNSILGYVSSLKVLKAADAEAAKQETAAAGPRPVLQVRAGKFELG